MPVKWVFDTKPCACDFFCFKNINLFNNSSFISLALLNIKQVKVKYLKTQGSSSPSEKVQGEGPDCHCLLIAFVSAVTMLWAAVGQMFPWLGSCPWGQVRWVPTQACRGPKGWPEIDSTNQDPETREDAPVIRVWALSAPRERVQRRPTGGQLSSLAGYQSPALVHSLGGHHTPHPTIWLPEATAGSLSWWITYIISPELIWAKRCKYLSYLAPW